MKVKEHIRAGSFDWAVVREALRRSMPPEKPSGSASLSGHLRDLEISVLLNDVFGGEILRIHKGRGWHFYNRINDECVDLSGQVLAEWTANTGPIENINTPEGPSGYFEQNDYTTFFQKFVTALEEAVGIGKYKTASTTLGKYKTASTIQ